MLFLLNPRCIHLLLDEAGEIKHSEKISYLEIMTFKVCFKFFPEAIKMIKR